MKKKLIPEIRDRVKDFLELNSKAIIKAELDTFKETLVSTHTARMYIFTLQTMGVADISLNEGANVYELLSDIIGKFKLDERKQIDDSDEMLSNYRFMGGSFVTGIILFLPSTALKIDITKLDELPPDLRYKAKANIICVQDIVGDTRYKERYKHLIEDVLSIHYVSFYTNRGVLHRIVHHKDEVLDMPVITEFGNDGDEAKLGECNLKDMHQLIEVE